MLPTSAATNVGADGAASSYSKRVSLSVPPQPPLPYITGGLKAMDRSNSKLAAEGLPSGDGNGSHEMS